MPPKTTEAEEPATTDRTMFWAIAFLLAVAVFGVGYAVGHAVAEDNGAFGGDIAFEHRMPGQQTDNRGSDDVNVGQGYLGVTARNTPGGVLVIDVVPGSAADKAGIERGDHVVAFDGESIVSRQQLGDVIRRTSPGTELEMVLGGPDGGRTITVILGERPVG